MSSTLIAPGAAQRDPVLWRSLLYVPASNARFVAKAKSRGADAIVLDLEDSVPASERAAARRGLAGAVEAVAGGHADVLVRINREDEEAAGDLGAAVCAQVSALVLPKADSFEHVCERAEQVTRLEHARGLAPGGIRFVLLVETPAGLLRAETIAGAHARNVAMSLGSEDLAAALGMHSAADTLLGPTQTVVLAARAAGITPLGLMGSIAQYRDLDALRDMAVQARRYGLEGAWCIHPSAVPVLNEVFSPGAEEVARAERIVAAYDTAQASGTGAIAVDGRMVDVPVAESARALLRRHARVQARRGAAESNSMD